MESQDCLFDMEDHDSIAFLDDNAQENKQHGYENTFQKESIDHIMNIANEMGNIPPSHEDLLINQKLIESEEASSGIYGHDLAKEAEIQSLFLDKCTQPGKEFHDRNPQDYCSLNSHNEGYLQSLVYEESKFTLSNQIFGVFQINVINEQRELL